MSLAGLIKRVKWAMIVLLGLSALADAASFGTLSGKVTDAKTNKPITGAVVILQIGSGMATQTSAAGDYIFSQNVPAGKHSVKVTKTGYDDKTVTGVEISTGVKALNVSLTPQAAAGSGSTESAKPPAQTKPAKKSKSSEAPAPAPPAPDSGTKKKKKKSPRP